ncbi:hypothetical protein DTO012A7_139 [Penicillium roqueforti]|uniref:uncharacterized protein n=1 Tax=Penicillium roqueforti TaxID=5082 RepID=UPI00190BF68E|nr:uncharacterized protein LCP9604111_8525 [Penicillium roqueforti]KAF9240985.1 hypothetical protein LCP9604111_8525 [Penicillium roqueforti]KAI3247221.1 hypothetical protein DTO012A7_139 [Penicillium roqueforti]
MSVPPFTVRSVFEYASGHDDDLNFPIGQIVTVTALEDDDWYYGEYSDAQGARQEGIFPKNFVEKYEPPAPPRPSRPRPKKEPETLPVESPVVESKQAEREPEPAVQPTEEDYGIQSSQPLPQSPRLHASAPVSEVVSSPPQPAKAPAPAHPVAPTESAAKAPSKPAPPAVADKPSGSSFRDRIAAFNKPAAAPVTPFKPGGSQPSFVKKPFVAPPPSRDAYKPPPREPAPKIYKREEDPDVKEQIAREPPVSESRPAHIEGGEEGAEDQPKPTSLKDRIALLQKQQLEQAQRHAEAAQKKEKPSRPPKKSMDEPVAPAVLDEEQEPPSVEEPPATRDTSVDTLRAAAPPSQPPAPFSPTQEVASDANDADYSAAADSEDAGETSTSKDDEEDQAQPRPVSRRQPLTPAVEQTAEADVEDEGDAEEEEEEEMDPETKRRMELRERMAKMSGGMGMMGLFGPPIGGMPGMPGMASAGSARKPKTPIESEKRLGELESEPTSPANAPPVPMIPLPGMNAASKPVPSYTEVEKEEEEPLATPLTEQHPARDVPDVEEVVHEGALPRTSIDRPAPAPPSQDRSAPPPPHRESRPVPTVPVEPPASPPPVPAGRPAPPLPRPTTADKGEESDDELSVHTSTLSLNNSPAPPPVPTHAVHEHIDSRRSSIYDPMPSTASTPAAEKRASRLPPPIPVNPPMPPSAQGRAPPPLPSDQLRRRSTVDSRTSALSAPRQAGEEAEGEVTEYDGDYDTDIASGVKHKDALKAHERESSFDEGIFTDDYSIQSPRSPQESRHHHLPPPPPTAPRAVPPPPPSQPPRNARASIDTPRGPPPPPPDREPNSDDDVEYDPFNYAAPRHGLPASPPVPVGRPGPPPPFPTQAADEFDDLYDAPPVQSPVRERSDKRLSLALPQGQASGLPSPSAARTQRASVDILRSQPNLRRSMDVSRPSIDQGYIATDVDFAAYTLWWTKPKTPPPAFQNRTDLLFEVEETASTNRSGKTTVSKDVYILFIDYSQTVLNVQFDPKNPKDASFEQRHEPPPLPSRQDQLEQAHIQLGTRISEAVNSVQNSTVGDGTPFGLVQHLLSPLSDALLPVGTRAYGASVYSNLANASVSQNDEIRAGDIVSFRNARFQGHRGTMHQKYSAEVGRPDHVGIVVDWDGTKKKIRAWEQGRESKKVKMESFKLNDLRSGECKVWRVMPRSWVGWEASK